MSNLWYIKSKRQFKSIKNLQWNGVPDFAVLTGKNGVGKTHLLSFLAQALDGGSGIEISSAPFDSHESKGDILSSGNLSHETMSVVYVYDSFQSITSSSAQAAVIQGSYNNQKIIADNFSGFDAMKPANILSIQDPLIGIARASLAYKKWRSHQISIADERGDRMIPESTVPKPWNLVNDLLEESGLSYKIRPPGSDIFEAYTPMFEENGNVISAQELSSGEKTLIGIVCAIYKGEFGGSLPDVILLDEPDAHLHPEMARSMLGTLKSILVDKYGIRIIITTHNPTTVSMSPDGSIFELEKGGIVNEISRWEAVSNLSSGLFAVVPSTRYVFVEDQEDKRFYESIVSIAESRSINALNTISSGGIVFIPAPLAGPGGGVSAVKVLLKTIDSPNFAALIDRDMGTGPLPDRAYRIGRYSIENYLMDPLLLISYLHRRHDYDLSSHGLGPGDSLNISEMREDVLQSIVNEISGKLAYAARGIGFDIGEENVVTTCSYIGGIEVKIPQWITGIRGHDLMDKVGPAAFSVRFEYSKLLVDMGISGAVPLEIVETIWNIAGRE